MPSFQYNPDLKVDVVSTCLEGVTIDLVVSGSIGAVESVKFIRSLRRLGAKVRPILTNGGKLFTTKEALEWASANSVTESFQGLATHIATGDLLVVAPASASIISKIAAGICDNPGSALAQSYMGSHKPVMILPNMHYSIMESSPIQTNIRKLESKITLLSPEKGEGKYKFPNPEKLADIVANKFNSQKTESPVLICMGSTRGYIDDVRYISNYSTGKLGTTISEELFRSGFKIHVVCGNSTYKPSEFTSIHHVSTNDEMIDACQSVLNSAQNNCHLIMLASVLDFVPDRKKPGKIKSDLNEIVVKLVATDKIIAKLNINPGHAKIGFKLEYELSQKTAAEIADEYLSKYSLTSIFLNSLKAVSAEQHSGFLFNRKTSSSTELVDGGQIDSKQSIALALKQNLLTCDAEIREKNDTDS